MTYRVLIIEDEEVWQKRWYKVFHDSLGYDVTVADNLDDAIDALRDAENPFDLVSVDMDLRRKIDDTWDRQDKEYPGMYVLKYIHQQHRGELCLIISNSQFNADQFEKLGNYRHFLIGTFSKDTLTHGELTTKVPELLRQRKHKVFICYRRQDSEVSAGRLYDHLANAFGKTNVFFDQHSMLVGQDFRDQIRKTIQICDAVLVIMGKQWLTIKQENSDTPRLFDPADYVRIEILEAMNNGIPVIPVLVEDAQMPSTKHTLPSELHPLLFFNGVEIRSGGGFEDDVRKLISALINKK